MPKIRKLEIDIYTKEISTKLTTDLFYNSDYGFYIFLPAEFHDAYRMTSMDENQKLGVKGIREGAHKNKIIISAVTETELTKNIEQALKHYQTLTVKETKVIAIWYECSGENRYKENDYFYGQDNVFPELKMELNFAYLVEAVSGTTRKFYELYNYGMAGEEKRINRQERHVNTDPKSWHPAIIIPDTPENRAFVETLHGKLRELITKMKEFTATTDKMIGLISSNQKLLN